MILKEAILGSEVARGGDIDHIISIAKMPVFPRVNIGFIDNLTSRMNRKQLVIAVKGVNTEMNEMGHDVDYSNSIRRAFLNLLVEKRYGYAEEIKPIVDEIKFPGGPSRINFLYDLARTIKPWAKEKDMDCLLEDCLILPRRESSKK